MLSEALVLTKLTFQRYSDSQLSKTTPACGNGIQAKSRMIRVQHLGLLDSFTLEMTQ